MSDQRNVLQSLFKAENRFANFGSALIKLVIRGFRCHASTVIDVDSPIIAFCGLNGTGKSTILQLAAAAYRSNTRGGKRYYIKDFVVAGTLDPSPFSPDASVSYSYWQENRQPKQVIINRSDPEKRWRNYKRQPSREVYFAGMGLYLPRVEVRDFIVRNASKVKVIESTDISQESIQWACQILGCNYQSMNANKVRHAGRTGEVVTVSRAGKNYSEANMGCGEGRIQHIIRVLETLPQKSLILLEEPETSLHPSAQHQFGRYLVNVCISKKHQIFISTHSEYLLTALPSASRIYLDRTTDSLRTIRGITTAQAISLMTEGHSRALHVLVEDEVAAAVLKEILRHGDSTFLRTIKIHPIGDTRSIQSVMKALVETGLPVAAVRDGDKEGNPRENIFKLPSELPPERELLNTPVVKDFLRSAYGIEVDDFIVLVQGIDHHQWFGLLAEKVSASEPALVQEVARIYIKSLHENEIDKLVNLLKGTIRV
ncbi:MAG: ATP-dependent nuclease [Syntrophobacteraceae bacterium]